MDFQNRDNACFPIISVPSQNDVSIRIRKTVNRTALISREKGVNGTIKSPANQTPASPISPIPSHFFQARISTVL